MISSSLPPLSFYHIATIPHFATPSRLTHRSPLVQRCYAALRELREMVDRSDNCDYYCSGMISAEEMWDALAPLRELVFEVDGTRLSERVDYICNQFPASRPH